MFAPRGLHDVKVWKSLSHEQRAWVTELLMGDAIAIQARESLACAFAFDLGQQSDGPSRFSKFMRAFRS